MSPINRLVTFLLGTAFIGCVTVYLLLDSLDRWAETPRSVLNDTIIELKPGTSLRSLSEQLEYLGIIDNDKYFMALMRIHSDYSKVQAGSYLFRGATSPRSILRKLLSGDVYVPIALQIIIPEGFTLKMLNERLAAKNVAKMHDLDRLVRDQRFIRSLGINAQSLEGFTYPATYNFSTLPDARSFYTQTVKTFFEKLPDGYEANIAQAGLNLTQAVTFASLIELETMREEEKPLISEVIWSRLKKGEPLGIDAAIIYGIANYDGDLKWHDLKNIKNKYNTRVHQGLPPGPIGAASRSSLLAVLNPSNLGYYYYVLDGDDPTRHLFAKTLSEHNANVRKLMKTSGRRGIKRNHGKENSR